jgi:hypothetical protein
MSSGDTGNTSVPCVDATGTLCIGTVAQQLPTAALADCCVLQGEFIAAMESL